MINVAINLSVESDAAPRVQLLAMHRDQPFTLLHFGNVASVVLPGHGKEAVAYLDALVDALLTARIDLDKQVQGKAVA